MSLYENILNEKLINYPTQLNSFIGGWFIPHKICDDIIEFMDKNKNSFTQGKTLDGIDLDYKDSMDMYIKPNFLDFPFRHYRSYLQNCLEEYIKIYPYLDQCAPFNITEEYNLQHYKKGGGFKKWHFENPMDLDSYKRVLVFMTYLNDIPDGGTEFYYQKLKTEAKKGLTLIWPAHWTHTHRGLITHSTEKKIVTGWYHTIDL